MRRAEARAQHCFYAIGHAVLVEPSISNMGYITTVLSTEDRARTGQKNGAIANATVRVELLRSVRIPLCGHPARVAR